MKPDNVVNQSVHWHVWRSSFITLFCVLAGLCLIFWPVLRDMATIWWQDTTYNHSFLVAPISAWLIYMRREEFVEINPRPHWPTALLLLPPAFVMIVGRAGSLALLEHLAFVSMLVVCIVAVMGWAFAKKFWFALGFLFFMVPLGVELVPVLQYMTAEASVWLIRLSGIPVFLDGILIQMPNGLFEVAEACAGIRFLIANIVVATLFSYFCFRTVWKVVLFMALAVIIPIGANCLRAYGIMMIAHFSNNELAVGVDHLVYGWLFFTIVMVILLWVGSLFADRHWADPLGFKKTLSFSLPTRADTRKLAVTAGLLGAFIVLGPVFNALIGSTQTITTEPNYPQIIIPEAQSNWVRKPADVSQSTYWSPVFRHTDATYRLDFENTQTGETVEVFVAWIGEQSQNKEIVHFSNRFDDDTLWKRGQLGSISVPDAPEAGLPTTARFDRLTAIAGTLEHSRFENKLVVSWYWVNGAFTSNAKMAKLKQIQSTLTGQNPSAGLIALATNYRDTPDDALAVLAPFLKAMHPADVIFESMQQK